LNKLASYIEDPNVNNIHDVRTSFRRLEAAYSVFPNSAKTRSSEKFLTLGKEFFRLNSVIRDSDVMLKKLNSDARSGPIIERLHQIRAENLEQALVVAQKLALLQEPQLNNKKLPLDKLLQLKVDHRISNIQHFIPLIRDDEENIEELHTLRKQAKKLFYLLEPNNDPADTPEMMRLKKLQTVAGDIHDCDVTIAFLNENSNSTNNIKPLVLSEQLSVTTCYEKLLSQFDKIPWQLLRRLT